MVNFTICLHSYFIALLGILINKQKANSKYLNFIDTEKTGSKREDEHIKVVPLNGYTPDLIKNAMQRK